MPATARSARLRGSAGASVGRRSLVVALGVVALGVVALGVVAGLVLGGAAWAFWTMGGEGVASAASGTLWAPANVVADAPVNSGTVAVSWDASTLSTGQPATGYYLVRVRDSDGAVAPACGTSASTQIATLSCDDVGVVDGTYHYTVTGTLGSWSATSANSPSVTVINDNSLPTVTASVSPVPNGNGWNNSSPVTVNLSAYAGFGIESITYAVDGAPSVTVYADTAAVPVTGDGVHTVTYSATDNPGNVSSTESVLVRIDLIAPDAPSAPVLVAASDSGSSSSDAITKVTAPTFTGTAEDGATVALFDGATAVGSAVATGGTYTITATTRPAGTHSFTAQATDLAANTGLASTETTVVIDTTAPAVQSAPVLDPASDSGISNSDRITNNTTPTFAGTAEAGSTVSLYSSTTLIGTATAAGDGTFSVNSIALTTGAKTVTTQATDVAGNISGSSPSVVVTIDVTAPTKPGTPDMIAAHDTGRSNADNNTSNTTPTIVGTVTAGSTVNVYSTIGAGPATVIGTVYAPSTTWSISSSALTNATHVVTAKATDAAGNQSSVSTSITAVIDTIAPPATSTPALASGHDTGRSSTDKITNKTAPTLSGTNDSRAIVALFEGGTQLGTVTTTSTTYAVVSSLLAPGAHTVSTIPTDVAGNVGPSSATMTFTIDNVAPAPPSIPALAAASDTGISSTDRLTKATAPIFTGTAEPAAYVRLYNGAVATGTSPGSTATGGGTYSGATSTLGTGSYLFKANATDVAGNISVFSDAIDVVVDLVLPTATINQATGQADPTTVSPIAYTATFSEPIYGFIGTDITYSGTALANTATVTGTGPYDVSVSGMVKSGTVTALLTATKVTDLAGNANTAATSTDATVTYNDVAAPNAPTTPVLTAATDTGFSNTDAITNDTTPTFTGTAEVGSTVRIYRAGGTLIATSAVVPVSGIYTATPASALANGAHTITATATDQTLNLSAASGPLTLTVDTVAPTVTLNQAVGQVDPTTVSPVDFTVTFSQPVYGFTGTGVTFIGTAGATAFAIAGTGPYNLAVSGMVRTGTVIPSLAASAARDLAGNLSSAATYTDRTVTYNDTVAPAVSITGFGPDGAGAATISGTADFGLGDNLSVTVVLCTVNVFPCSGPNTKATLTGVPVDAGTGAWNVTSGFLGTTTTLYARATQTDLTGNIGTSAVAGPVAIP